jgi:hypothetical protein
VRLPIRFISAAAIAAACLALAACTSSGSSGNAANQAGPRNAANAAGQQGTPASAGTVTVKQGNRVICVMTVTNGKGTCQVPARNFGVGTSQIYASYSGDGKAGRSKPVPMTVNRATTTATLTLSPARVGYANEQAARLSVTVTGAHGGTPTGTVKVASGGITVCLIKLSAAKGAGAAGSCALAAKKLAIGSRPLVASYAGDHWYAGATSPAKTLTVVR